jgi:hypothetical protein
MEFASQFGLVNGEAVSYENDMTQVSLRLHVHTDETSRVSTASSDLPIASVSLSSERDRQSVTVASPTSCFPPPRPFPSDCSSRETEVSRQIGSTSSSSHGTSIP